MNARSGAPAASLPPLNAPCRKCGSETRDILWIPDLLDDDHERPDAPLPYTQSDEHIRVTCRGCGFVWPAAPLDAGDGGGA